MKKYTKRELVLLGLTIILAAFAILVGVGMIEIGETGINFNFLFLQ